MTNNILSSTIPGEGLFDFFPQSIVGRPSVSIIEELLQCQIAMKVSKCLLSVFVLNLAVDWL